MIRWLRGLSPHEQIGLLAALTTLALAAAGLARILGGRLAGLRRRLVAWLESKGREGLAAAELPETPGFRNRGRELTLLERLWTGQVVTFVEGPPLSGKTWLISEFLRRQAHGMEAIYVDMRPGRSLSGLLRAINSGLVQRGETSFNALCLRADVPASAKLRMLSRLLQEQPWVIALDSYERVAAHGGIDAAVRQWQRTNGPSRLVIGTRRRPAWSEAPACVQMGPMPQADMQRVCEDAGLTEAESVEVALDRGV